MSKSQRNLFGEAARTNEPSQNNRNLNNKPVEEPLNWLNNTFLTPVTEDGCETGQEFIEITNR